MCVDHQNTGFDYCDVHFWAYPSPGQAAAFPSPWQGVPATSKAKKNQPVMTTLGSTLFDNGILPLHQFLSITGVEGV